MSTPLACNAEGLFVPASITIMIDPNATPPNQPANKSCPIQDLRWYAKPETGDLKTIMQRKSTIEVFIRAVEQHP